MVDFAEIEKFINTPVKHYSSGMYVRLAFAVAAHLEPEILLVDEVLAVGDATFQKKCLGKMGEVSRGGRTVLLVSHNMAAVQQVTSRCLLLENGKLTRDAETPEVVAAYLAGGHQEAAAEDLSTDHPDFHIHSVRFDDARAQPGFNQPLHFELSLSLGHDFETIGFGLGIYNSLGARLLTSRCVVDVLEEGKTGLSICIADHHLPPGQYALALGIARGTQKIYYAENVLSFGLSDLGVMDPLIQPYLAQQRDQIGAFIPGRWEKV
jgi:lipopolysaccharide transport system ATP-binding protein